MSAFWGGFAQTVLDSRQAEQKRADEEKRMRIASELQQNVALAIEAAREQAAQRRESGAVVNSMYDFDTNAMLQTTAGGEQRRIPLPEAARAQYAAKMEAERMAAERQALMDEVEIDRRRSSSQANRSLADLRAARTEETRNKPAAEPKRDVDLDKASEYVERRLDDIYNAEKIELSTQEKLALARKIRQTVAGGSDIYAIGSIIDRELQLEIDKKEAAKAAAAAARGGR